MKSGVHRSLDGLSFSQIPKLAKPMMVAINIAHQCSPMSYSLYAGFHTGFFCCCFFFVFFCLFFLGGGGGERLGVLPKEAWLHDAEDSYRGSKP